ncbi:MAG: hypothetical protein ACYDA8_17590, partial [Deferrisomatales bacterium]
MSLRFRGRPLRFGAACLILGLLAGGCRWSSPPPTAEVELAERLAGELEAAGAAGYAAEAYGRLGEALASARASLAREQGRLFFLRDYAPVGERYRGVAAEAQALLERVRALTDERAQAVAARLESCRGRIA